MRRHRIVLHVLYDRRFGMWRVGQLAYRTKAEAVKIGREAARCRWDLGQPAQLIVHTMNGKFQYEHTYGHDPKRRKG